MKLYQIERTAHGEFIQRVEFAGSQADARRTRLDMEEPFKALKPKDRPNVIVTELDVPTDKKGLIEALNEIVAGVL